MPIISFTNKVNTGPAPFDAGPGWQMIITAMMGFPHRDRDGCREWNAARKIRFLSHLKVALFFDSSGDHELPWALADSQDGAPYEHRDLQEAWGTSQHCDHLSYHECYLDWHEQLVLELPVVPVPF